MPKLALILYAGFLFVAFGWRSWLQYRRTGDAGVRHPSASAAPLEWLASALVIVGFVAIPAVCIGLPRSALLTLLFSCRRPEAYHHRRAYCTSSFAIASNSSAGSLTL